MKKGKLTIVAHVVNTGAETESHTVTGKILAEGKINEANFPNVEYAYVGQRGIDDYKERKRKDVVGGYSIKIAGSVVHNVFIIADGTHEHEHLFTDLLELAGNATQQASYLRGAVQSAQGFAHTVKNYAETYKNFFGPLTPEHLDWMKNNLPTFEQALNDAKAKAKTISPEDNES